MGGKIEIKLIRWGRGRTEILSIWYSLDIWQIVHLLLKSRTFTYTIREKRFKGMFYVQYFPDNF